jgi:exosortase/archaeosortase family protein
VRTKLKSTSHNLLDKTTVPILKRTVIFLSLFVIISGVLGPHIINYGLSNKDGFQIYGGAGKSLLFGIICLLIMVQRQEKEIKFSEWHKGNVILLILSGLSTCLAWYSINHLIGQGHNSTWPLLANISILASIVFAAGFSFGPYNIKLLLITYKNELVASLILAITFYFFLLGVYSLWKFLSNTVLHAVSGLLHLVGLSAVIIPPRTLLLNKFGISIAEYCSGIESIALFTGLYTLIGVLDWHRLKHARFLYIFPLALLVLFGVNILRVFVLILAGYYINPHIAFTLFHTYAGMIFFILYSAIFWAISYNWMLTKTSRT